MPYLMNLWLGKPIGIVYAFRQRYYQKSVVLHYLFLQTNTTLSLEKSNLDA